MSVSLPGLYQVFLGAMGAPGGGLAWAIALSVVLGAVHALSPGHGKALVVASLMGSRGSLPRALGLAATVALTHTVSVLVLALVVTAANAMLLPQALTPVITLAVAVLTVAFGIDLTRRAIRARAGGREHDDAGHGHHHDGPSAPPGLELSRRYTLSVGVLGGLVPNATALVVVLMAGTFGQVGTGILVVVFYGVGIAVVVAAIGVGSVILRRFGGAARPDGVGQRMVALLPLISGLVVVLVGVVLTLQAASGLLSTWR